MRSTLITLGSVLLTASVIGNAYYQKKQFYPSVVYITKSNSSMAVIYLQAFVLVLLMGKLMRKVFFGQLRAAEMEHLIERSWYAVTETCLAFTVFRDDLSPKFVALFTLLLFLKCFHWLAEDRVDYMERSPNISLLFHVRVFSLLTLLGSLDILFVNLAYHTTLTKGASVQLVFGFEYAILLTIVINIFLKYALHFFDLQRDNPWENKAVYLLYTELLMGFMKVVLYLTFITIMMKIHTFPLFAIRPMYLSMRAFKKALNDVIMSRRAIRNMNTLYPNATPEELASVDNVCIICREEMTGNGSAKKLPCNHIFHISCLRSWFQRQQTCPTCRMDVLRAPAATPTPAATPQPQPQPQQPQNQQMPQAQVLFAAQFNPMMANFLNFPSQNATTSQTASFSQNQPSASTSPSNFSPPLFTFPPFMPFIGPPPPMPTPPSNLNQLSLEELRRMEGSEREAVEARIRCLQNIKTLLDAAVMQLQQYNTVVNSGNLISASSRNNTAEQQEQQRRSAPQTDPTSSSSLSDTTINTNASSSPSDIIRQRRLQRFSQTQVPVIDAKSNTVVESASQNDLNSDSRTNESKSEGENSKKTN
ncbi:E3 ubiquitin-protein ligase synoviolin B-like protein [Dinothrombium tinctorium]|uniref:RING-type E3 ubiquitin transferase n=1 Tax=Dinothrombium tinctorium TaxID=1965070 RepID=A0A3S3PE54_9ACAR|nr:E3 ubiquitin-protein ligase synoviolin B-like protein [Dinothrombium tinctorium]RWS13392.1 E3 ubiquitin-protein ligase synoviolin B-like protein [Dinothrombium tinctorium]